MRASTTLAGDLFDQPYAPPTQEIRRFWAKKDAKFQTRTGHVPHQVRSTVRNCQGVLLTWKIAKGIGNLRTQAMRLSMVCEPPPGQRPAPARPSLSTRAQP